MTELETHLLKALARLQGGHSEHSEQSQKLLETLTSALAESEKQNKQLLNQCEQLAQEQKQIRSEYQAVQMSLSNLTKHVKGLMNQLDTL